MALALGACSYGKTPPPTKPPIAKEEVKPETKDPSELDPSKSAITVPVKVAILLPLSGKFRKLGKALQRAAEMAVFETKSKNLRMVPIDTGGTADGAIEAVDKAVSSGAKLIIGPVFSEAVAAAKDRAKEAGLNMISFSNNETVAGDNVFLLSFLVRQQVDRIIQYAVRQDIKTIGVLVPSSESGRRIVGYAREAADKYGANITKVGFFAGSMAKMTTQVKGFAAGRPYKGVLIHAGRGRLRSLASLLAFYDVDSDRIKFMGTGKWDHKSTRSEPSLKDGWFASPPPENRERFMARFASAHKERPPRLASLAYDAVALAASLARKATSPEDNPFTVEAITNPSGFIGVDGLFRFRENGLSERGLAILQVTPEEFRTIGEPPTTFVIGTN